MFVKDRLYALAGMAQLVGASSHNPKVVGSISSEGAYLGCRFNPWSRCLQEATNQCCSLALMFLSLPSSLSLKAMRKCPWMRIKKRFHIHLTKFLPFFPSCWHHLDVTLSHSSTSLCFSSFISKMGIIIGFTS